MRACEALTNTGVAQTFVDMGEIRMASDEVYQHQDYTHRHGDNYLTHHAQRVGLASKKPTFFDLGILIVLRSSLLFISFSYLSAFLVPCVVCQRKHSAACSRDQVVIAHVVRGIFFSVCTSIAVSVQFSRVSFQLSSSVQAQ